MAQSNFRMLPPNNASQQTVTANGRTYSGAPGSTLDVPDFDAQILAANGWVMVCASGPSSSRPLPIMASAPYVAGPGFQYLDTTLGAVIVYDGAAWRNPLTGEASDERA